MFKSHSKSWDSVLITLVSKPLGQDSKVMLAVNCLLIIIIVENYIVEDPIDKLP